MSIRDRLPALASLLLASAFATPAMAGISPYVRIEFGGSQLRLSEVNSRIEQNEAAFNSSGIPVEFDRVGTAFGPSASLGLWIVPWFRVGATYSSMGSTVSHEVHIPGMLFYADELEFQMTEIGGEAAVRIPRLGGLTLGGSIAQGRAEMVEGFAAEDGSGQLYLDANAEKTGTTYGGFIGFDQTNPAGIAGFVRAGFQVRDMGEMPSQMIVSDGTTTSQVTGTTVPLDYSGYYVRIGVGFDLMR